MVTVMAAPMLGEQVTRSRWISVAVGFVGVLVVTNPWGVPISCRHCWCFWLPPNGGAASS